MQKSNWNYVSYEITSPPNSVIKEVQNLKQEHDDQQNYVDLIDFSLNNIIEDIPNTDDNLIEEHEYKKENKTKKENNKNQIKMENNENKTKIKTNTSFEQAYNEAVMIDPEVSKYREFLVRTAKRESNFKNIQNTAGAPYYGFFQMGKDQIKATLGISVEEFIKDPVKQILGAVKLYKINLKTAKATGTYDLCKKQGYSDDAIIAGAWLGGVGGVKKYITGKGNPSDSHWYGGKSGTSVGKVMNNWMNNVG